MSTLDQLDRMGAWSESGDAAWLPVEFHPTRGKAKAFWADESGAYFLDVRCRHVYIAPRDTPGDWCDVLWLECPPFTPGAIAAWHVRERPRKRLPVSPTEGAS